MADVLSTALLRLTREPLPEAEAGWGFSLSFARKGFAVDYIRSGAASSGQVPVCSRSPD
jgi:hypothetical protein